MIVAKTKEVQQNGHYLVGYSADAIRDELGKITYVAVLTDGVWSWADGEDFTENCEAEMSGTHGLYVVCTPVDSESFQEK